MSGELSRERDTRRMGVGYRSARLGRNIHMLWAYIMRNHARHLVFRWVVERCCIGEHEGIRICDFAGEPHLHDAFLARTIEALDLLRELDPRRFRRVQRYISYVGHAKSKQLRNALGVYDWRLRICYVCADDYTPGTADDYTPGAADDSRLEGEQDTDASYRGNHDSERSAHEYEARAGEYRRMVREHDLRQFAHDSQPTQGEAWLREQEALAKDYRALEREYHVLSATTEAIEYAATLVHEATHGVLHARGVRHTRSNCVRIERLCLLEERRLVERYWPWELDLYPNESDAESPLDDRRRPLLARLLSPRR